MSEIAVPVPPLDGWRMPFLSTPYASSRRRSWKFPHRCSFLYALTHHEIVARDIAVRRLPYQPAYFSDTSDSSSLPLSRRVYQDWHRSRSGRSCECQFQSTHGTSSDARTEAAAQKTGAPAASTKVKGPQQVRSLDDRWRGGSGSSLPGHGAEVLKEDAVRQRYERKCLVAGFLPSSLWS